MFISVTSVQSFFKLCVCRDYGSGHVIRIWRGRISNVEINEFRWASPAWWCRKCYLNRLVCSSVSRVLQEFQIVFCRVKGLGILLGFGEGVRGTVVASRNAGQQVERSILHQGHVS